MLGEQAVLEDDLGRVNEQIEQLNDTYADEQRKVEREATEVADRKRDLETAEATLAKAELAADAAVRTMNGAEAAKEKELADLRGMHHVALRRCGCARQPTAKVDDAHAGMHAHGRIRAPPVPVRIASSNCN